MFSRDPFGSSTQVLVLLRRIWSRSLFGYPMFAKHMLIKYRQADASRISNVTRFDSGILRVTKN